MIKVGPEPSLADFALKIAVGRCDDSGMGNTLPGFANPLVLAVLKYPQKLWLQVEGQFTNLIEKQRSFRRFLEIPRPDFCRTGECPLGMAEQRWFHKTG